MGSFQSVPACLSSSDREPRVTATVIPWGHADHLHTFTHDTTTPGGCGSGREADADAVKRRPVVKHGSLKHMTPHYFGDIYLLGRKIAAGTFGSVYIAHHRHLQEKRAVKIVRKDVLRRSRRPKNNATGSVTPATDVKERWGGSWAWEEAALLNDLDHPSIVRVYEVYEDEDHVYCVMEMSKGGELFDRFLQRNFTEPEAAEILKQLLGAVAYLHEQGICHRDIKLENVMFDSSDRDTRPPGLKSLIKLIDFGCAVRFTQLHPIPSPTFKPKTHHHQQQQQPDIDKEPLGEVVETMDAPEGYQWHRQDMRDVVGTTLYMAPEMFTGRYDESVDVWACGVLLYMLLCGRPPYVGESEEETEQLLRRVAEGQHDARLPLVPRQVWDRISQSCIDLVTRLLQHDPNKRISASRALQHPWLQYSIPSVPYVLPRRHKWLRNTDVGQRLARMGSSSVDKGGNTHMDVQGAIEAMRDFPQTNALQQLVLRCIVRHLMSKAESNALLPVFRAIETPAKAGITLRDLRKAANASFKRPSAQTLIKSLNDKGTHPTTHPPHVHQRMSTKEAQTCFQRVDMDGDGVISWSEFVLATASRDHLLTEQRLAYVFEMLDADGDGIITAHDIMHCLAPNRYDHWTYMWCHDILHGAAVDSKRTDAPIDYIEFLDIMAPLVPSSSRTRTPLPPPRGLNPLTPGNRSPLTPPFIRCIPLPAFMRFQPCSSSSPSRRDTDSTTIDTDSSGSHSRSSMLNHKGRVARARRGLGNGRGRGGRGFYRRIPDALLQRGAVSLTVSGPTGSTDVSVCGDHYTSGGKDRCGTHMSASTVAGCSSSHTDGGWECDDLAGPTDTSCVSSASLCAMDNHQHKHHHLPPCRSLTDHPDSEEGGLPSIPPSFTLSRSRSSPYKHKDKKKGVSASSLDYPMLDHPQFWRLLGSPKVMEEWSATLRTFTAEQRGQLPHVDLVGEGEGERERERGSLPFMPVMQSPRLLWTTRSREGTR
ncbi:unnamed protein product [Vitrella brassicaformis CCMP3155]|uniref:Calmodulin n=2 Tax=Vitrella brassicaformis TaxID=1169539 RepID=A0A0G4FW24_VITBC|nr:unnamed protein product [Vitrella brassicaformis CCMP3155]|eukprot:CEM19395.1 unnamed protein product [Vitrella brassicaformis CCMP3155]